MSDDNHSIRRPKADEGVMRAWMRYRKIALEKVRDDLRRWMRDGGFLTRQEGKLIHVPMPQIVLPRIRFAPPGNGISMGIGNGMDVQPGDKLKEGNGQGKKGGPGGEGGEHEHGQEQFRVTREEMARILGDELSLPNLVRKESGEVEIIGYKHNGRAKIGPRSQLLARKTLVEAMKRQIAEGTYDEDDPIILPEKSDMRYRAVRPVTQPLHKAAIFFIRDVSASMGEEEQMLSMVSAWWLRLWVDYCYGEGAVEVVYILHDVRAWEAPESEFKTCTSGGGTLLEPAINLMHQIIKRRFDPRRYNIYGFYYGDGDVWGADIQNSVKALARMSLDVARFGYTEVGRGSSQRNGLYQAMQNVQKGVGEGNPLSKMLRSVKAQSTDDIEHNIKELLSE